ncbi:MAG TPA: L,D-transpeptidase family protein [Solirubrobacteraceae bacterium]|nr:L,D-transpeptidase family protein [Solirubrobacteraceae bacterium]
MPERHRRFNRIGLVTLLVCALTPAAALAAEAAPTSPLPPAPVPAAGSIRLVLQHTHGRPARAVVGERFVVRGIVTPYVPGQQVELSIYRNARRVLTHRAPLSPLGNGTAQFHFSYRPPHSGLVQVRAEHVATAQLAAFKAKSVSVRYEPSQLSIGAGGSAVWILQDELAALHYQVPISGRFDEATARAVLAFRKLTGQARIESVNSRIFELLQEGAGSFHVRYPHDGNHVEADLSRQVLAEIERGGRVRRIITISSGKPSTPTVIGRFRVYRKEPGTNSHGMVDSSYFISGYAIHGYAEVPAYAASHGCLRIPVPDAAAVYAWVQIGYPVDVYTDSGGGSHTVRKNAGP